MSLVAKATEPWSLSQSNRCTVVKADTVTGSGGLDGVKAEAEWQRRYDKGSPTRMRYETRYTVAQRLRHSYVWRIFCGG